MPDPAFRPSTAFSVPPLNWPVIFGFWALICVVFVARALVTGSTQPLISDSDDAMRLSVVRDFLAGQNWFDHTQYRLNVPHGAEIPWSRLVDLPIAALVLLFQPLVGDFAYTLAAWVWPLLLLLGLLAVSARLTTFLVGPEGLLPGLVLPVLSAAVLVEFAPGRIDHHGVQIILVLLMLYAAIRAWRSLRWAAIAGLVGATSMAVAMETLPQIITLVLVFGLAYVVDESRGRAARLFALAFAAGTAFHLLLFLPPDRWNQAACDALSPVYASAAIGVWLVFALLSFISQKNWRMRLLAGAVLGAVLVGALLLAFPQCLGGPYGFMDPWLKQNWLSQIIEAKPVWFSFQAMPAYTLGLIIPALAALLVLGIFILRSDSPKRAEWMILGLFLLGAVLVVAAQVRGARLLAGMVVPVGAWAIVEMRRRYLRSGSVLHALGLLGLWLAFSGMAVAVLAGLALPGGADEAGIASARAQEPVLTRSACLQPAVFEDLARIPPERIMAPLDLGAHLLLFTPHGVVGAPYHRNQQGLADTLKFFNMPLDEARFILEQRGISLVVTCPYLPEMNGFADADENAFVRRFRDDALPDWLEDVSLPGAVLRVYAVRPRSE